MAVLSAIRLRDTQTFGKQDPYVVLKCGGHADTFRTKVCRDGGTAPKWNERFTFALAGTEGNELNLRIWNRNTMTSDKCIGSATVKLDAVFKNETDDVDVEVFDTKGRAAGVINLVLTFTPSGSYVVQQQQQQPAYVVQQQQQQPAYLVQQQQQQPHVVQQQQKPRGLVTRLTGRGKYTLGDIYDIGAQPRPAQPQQATPNVTYVQLPAYAAQHAPEAPPGYTPTPIGVVHGGYAGGGNHMMPPPPGWNNAPQSGGHAQYGSDDDEWGV